MTTDVYKRQVLYRILMNVDLPVGNTLPDMIITIILCVIAGAVLH